MCCFDGTCSLCRENRYRPVQPLAEWEKELLNGRPEGEGDATFTRLDGRKVVIENVRVDSIGTDGAEPLFNVAVENFHTGEIIHLPFIQSWTIDY